MKRFFLRIPGNTNRFFFDFIVLVEDDNADETTIAKAIASKYRNQLIDIFKFNTFAHPITIEEYLYPLDTSKNEAYYRALSLNFNNDRRVLRLDKADTDAVKNEKQKQTREEMISSVFDNIISYNDKIMKKSVQESVGVRFFAQEEIQKLRAEKWIRQRVFPSYAVFKGSIRELINDGRLTTRLIEESQWRITPTGIIGNAFWYGKRRNGKIVMMRNVSQIPIKGERYNINPKDIYILESNDKIIKQNNRLVYNDRYIVKSKESIIEKLDMRTGLLESFNVNDIIYVLGVTNPRLTGIIGIHLGKGFVVTEDGNIIWVSPVDMAKVGKAIESQGGGVGGGDIGITTNDLTMGALPTIITTPTKMLKFKNKSGTILNIFYADRNGKKTATSVTKSRNRYRVKTTKENGVRNVKTFANIKQALKAVIEDVKEGKIYIPSKKVFTNNEIIEVYDSDNIYSVVWDRNGWGGIIKDNVVSQIPKDKPISQSIPQSPNTLIFVNDNNIYSFIGLTESADIVTDKGVVPATFINHAITIDDVNLEKIQVYSVAKEIKATKLEPNGIEKPNEKLPVGEYIVIQSSDETNCYFISRDKSGGVYKLSTTDLTNYKNNKTINEVMSDKNTVNSIRQKLTKALSDNNVIDKREVDLIMESAIHWNDSPIIYYSPFLDTSKIYETAKRFKPLSNVYIFDIANRKIAQGKFQRLVSENALVVAITDSQTPKLKKGDMVIVYEDQIETQ